MRKVDESLAFRLSAELLARLGTDPAFAKRFDRNPGAALKEVFPALTKVPTENINDELLEFLRGFEKVPLPPPLCDLCPSGR